MTVSSDFDRLVATWLESSGPSEPEPETVRFALIAARRTPQRAGFRARLAGADAWPHTGSLVYLRHGWLMAAAIAMTIAAIAGTIGAGAILLSRTDGPNVVVESPSPSPASSPGASLGSAPDALVSRWLGWPRPLPGFQSTDDAFLEIGDTTLSMSTRSSSGDLRLHLNSALRADGATLALRTDFSDACAEDAIGSYRWSLTAGGGTLMIETIDDDCQARAAVVSGWWYRQACLQTGGHWCLGDLEPGRHLSWTFATTTDADGAWRRKLGTLAYDVPGGWTNSQDFEAGYWLEPTAWHDDLIQARGGVDNGDRPVANGIYVMSRPVAPRQTGNCVTGVADPSVGELADDLVRYLVDHPALRASTPEPVMIGELPGTMVDVELNDSWTGSCPGATVRMAQVFTTKSGNVPAAWNDAGTAAGAADRYIVLDVGGRPVVIQISASSPAALSALLPEAMPIVQSFLFAP